MGRKKRTIEIDQDEAFRQLDSEYRENKEGDPYVSALNRIPADERSLMIMFVVYGLNKIRLASKLDCSWPYLHGRITEIQNHIKTELQKIPHDEDLY